jgi:hypothetical protein
VQFGFDRPSYEALVALSGSRPMAVLVRDALLLLVRLRDFVAEGYVIEARKGSERREIVAPFLESRQPAT